MGELKICWDDNITTLKYKKSQQKVTMVTSNTIRY